MTSLLKIRNALRFGDFDMTPECKTRPTLLLNRYFYWSQRTMITSTCICTSCRPSCLLQWLVYSKYETLWDLVLLTWRWRVEVDQPSSLIDIFYWSRRMMIALTTLCSNCRPSCLLQWLVYTKYETLWDLVPSTWRWSVRQDQPSSLIDIFYWSRRMMIALISIFTSCWPSCLLE